MSIALKICSVICFRFADVTPLKIHMIRVD